MDNLRRSNDVVQRGLLSMASVLLTVLGGLSVLAQEHQPTAPAIGMRGSTPDSTQVWALSEVLQAAERHGTTAEQQSLIRDMTSRLGSALRTAYLPQLSVSATYHHQSDVTSLQLQAPDEPLFAGAELLGLPSMKEMMERITLPQLPKDNYQLSGTLSQVIWDGGRVRAAQSRVLAEGAVQSAEAAATAYRIRGAVYELYFGLLASDHQIAMQRSLVEELELRYDQASDGVAEGVTPQSDLDRLQMARLQAQGQLSALAAARQALLEALQMYTGIEGLTAAVFAMPPRPHSFADSRVQEGIQRPELLALSAQSLRAGAEWQGYRAGVMPTVGLFVQGGYGLPGLNILYPEPSPYLIYGVRLSWEIGGLYRWGAERNRYSRTEQVIALNRVEIERSIRAEQLEQQAEAEAYALQYQHDLEVLKLAHSIEQRALVQLQEGVITYADYMEQVTRRMQAELQTALHQIYELRALYRMQHTVGGSVEH